jgi:hypothetical protein
MTTMFIEKISIKDLEDTIANSTPLLALVGAGDLAVEKLRAARDEFAGRAAAFDPKTVRDQAQASFGARLDALQADLLSAPERLQAIPELAQEWPVRAQSLFADVLSQAFSTYGDLAGRGKHLVSQVRRDMPDGLEVDIEVTPVSRPTTSTARRTTTAATTTPAAPTGVSTTTPTASAKPTATTKPATTAKSRTTTKSTAPKSTASKSTAAKSTAKKATKRASSTTSKPAAKKPATKRATAKTSTAASSPAKKRTTKRTSTSRPRSAGTKS